MLQIIKGFLLTCSILFLVSCSHDVSQYRTLTPEFKLHEFFAGKIKAWGMVVDLQGNITRRFNVDITGTWQNQPNSSLKQGVLDEHFVYDDNEKQFRQWRITQIDEHTFAGEADDIKGTALGKQAGPVLQWQYEMLLEVDGTSYNVMFDDTMVQIDERRLLNKADIKKFGITVATVIIFFEKQP
ncbi:DUF3833 domain-containing protein [Flocculibacter collagenilyticus]|uniref:DUF3833 domain-containing protein n=1 Tax=Flocculibacter collagenilyticus TaxID=2744479 RepID=UPI0018F5E819|nr:DUF3833 domain-containing protein [Flocculibacter collagenilyticus]